MAQQLTLHHCDANGLAWAQWLVTEHHYRHAPVDARSSPQAWRVEVAGLGIVGCLIVNRPEASRCYPWYGSLADVASGRAQLSYWQVLNLARVYLSPRVQPGGHCFGPEWLPGFTDRRGVWRSTLASAAIALLARRVGWEYLLHRPPCFLDEPFAVRWLLSYCDPAYHKGTIYRASGFRLHRTNRAGLQTWRRQLPGLSATQRAAILRASGRDARARRFRAGRAQLALPLAG